MPQRGDSSARISTPSSNRAGLATFDERLARAASTFGIAVVDLA
ncbi:hypothetical protein [Agromyces bauzanensis]|nr:hypothetical protein [Agromyces bauzanensis]